MGRPLHPTSAVVVYHVLNRANARRTLFEDDGDYAACGAVNWNLTPSQNSNGYGAMTLRKADGVMM